LNFCDVCKRQISGRSTYCPTCGVYLWRYPTAEAIEPNIAPRTAQSNSKNYRWVPIGILLLVALFCIPLIHIPSNQDPYQYSSDQSGTDTTVTENTVSISASDFCNQFTVGYQNYVSGIDALAGSDPSMRTFDEYDQLVDTTTSAFSSISSQLSQVSDWDPYASAATAIETISNNIYEIHNSVITGQFEEGRDYGSLASEIDQSLQAIAVTACNAPEGQALQNQSLNPSEQIDGFAQPKFIPVMAQALTGKNVDDVANSLEYQGFNVEATPGAYLAADDSRLNQIYSVSESGWLEVGSDIRLTFYAEAPFGVEPTPSPSETQ